VSLLLVHTLGSKALLQPDLGLCVILRSAEMLALVVDIALGRPAALAVESVLAAAMVAISARLSEQASAGPCVCIGHSLLGGSMLHEDRCQLPA